jgi:ribosome biogenesis protein MAK21
VYKLAFAMMRKVISFQELDEEEHFTDVVDTTEDTNNPQSPAQNDVTKAPNNTDHVTSSHGHVFVDSSRTPGYHANARNPLYSGADSSCLWEVMKLSRHYHPSVSRFAQNMLQVFISI